MTLESFLVSTDKLQMGDQSSGWNGFRKPELEGGEDRHHGRRTDNSDPEAACLPSPLLHQGIVVQCIPFDAHYTWCTECSAAS